MAVFILSGDQVVGYDNINVMKAVGIRILPA